mgnify:CR=1 FL=1
MKFSDLQKQLKETFGATKLADIAREFDVTPQVVSNWKARNYVPYKYVQSLRNKIERAKDPYRKDVNSKSTYETIQNNPFLKGQSESYEHDEQEFVRILFILRRS